MILLKTMTRGIIHAWIKHCPASTCVRTVEPKTNQHFHHFIIHASINIGEESIDIHEKRGVPW